MLKKWPTTHLCDWCGAEMFDEDTTSYVESIGKRFKVVIEIGFTRTDRGDWDAIVRRDTWPEVCEFCFIHFEKHARAIVALTKGEPPA